MKPRKIREAILWLAARKRRTKQAILVITDTALFSVAVWLGYSIRYSVAYQPDFIQTLLICAGPAIGVTVMYGFGLYRSVTRYVGEQALWTIFKAVGLTAVLWALVALIVRVQGYTVVPRTVLVLFWLLSLLLIAGFRYTLRWLIHEFTHNPMPRRKILIYGGDDAGRQIAATLKHSNHRMVIFQVDDDPTLWGATIGGIKISAPAEVESLIERHGISEAIVTMRRANISRRAEVVAQLSGFGLRVRILPAFADIVDGKHTVDLIRDVEIGDLLGRDAVPPEPGLMEVNTRGKSVLVTGAGGSIGSELCRQLSTVGVARLVMMDSSELALYQIDKELAKQAGLETVTVLGSVHDAALMRAVMSDNQVNTVFHAAAYKHVPLVEANPFEGIRNNTFGTFAVASAAFESNVEVFVLISTDKAVRPSSVMGASKRLAELIVQHFAEKAAQDRTGQVFCAVRFGNVIGSSGSVIPLFKEQIRNGGPVTVTHAETSRYFMSIEEAAQLVIQAGSLARRNDETGKFPGRIFLLDMGQAVRIMDLAVKMIQLSNLTLCDDSNPNGDIAIEEIGLRPGEKLHEELYFSVEAACPTSHQKISVAAESAPDGLDIDKMYKELQQLSARKDHAGLMALLRRVAGMGLPAD
ncbi:nucleoside-diphosphate sugar epimerase/dehydratase [Hoeflea sp. YIM 152468]|uniref:polysaccharide biosynthesis protein n=1 Tax=Hoeflea sp. YIM 152468 TaxID=3031759 RepID=UPI0023DC73DA|nr:nucleoside-diphosphate sugar epimerase/dehydratase [Hoeflea sp. YIM 152468]MDF1608410.1 nucleoside-diphosphate sugar epimerase/dehydratase [Hoeflea sp. YIM 152468]